MKSRTHKERILRDREGVTRGQDRGCPDTEIIRAWDKVRCDLGD